MHYVRIGTTYYKSGRKPLASGDSTEMLVPWSIECIKQDHGTDFVASIKRYDGFCRVPGHLNYQREIENFYNRYHPFPHSPSVGYPQQILLFLNYVFGNQLDIGLYYFEGAASVPHTGTANFVFGKHGMEYRQDHFLKFSKGSLWRQYDLSTA